jgi:tRNA(Ile)-lysidine synthase
MEKTIEERFIQFIKEKHLCQKGDKLLLALSGGSDSMVMCDLFIRNGFNIGLAHCNFQLRAGDADRDENFVKQYAEKKNVPFFSIRFDTEGFSQKNKISIQQAARELRYNWFEQIRQQHQYTFIATAHHLNDNIETLLLNFFKGTGIHGLHGIPVKQGKIIRPLLFLSKKEILGYADLHKIDFVEDISNLSEKYTRNYLRHQVIPALEKPFPNLIHQLAQKIARFKGAEQLYEQAIDLHKKKLVEERGEEIFIPVLKLKKSSPLSTIAYEVFKPYGFSFEQSQQIIQLLDSESGKVVRSKTHQLLRDRKWLIVSPLKIKNPTHTLIEEGTHQVEVYDLKLNLKKKPGENYIIPKDENIASLDASKIGYPLILRKWKQGDYFYPLGMRKKKKLSRFFIDKKLSLNEKEKVWVLESNQRIIWVIGLRIDDRFKITNATKEVLQVASS